MPPLHPPPSLWLLHSAELKRQREEEKLIKPDNNTKQKQRQFKEANTYSW
jgi:hypothetical protein